MGPMTRRSACAALGAMTLGLAACAGAPPLAKMAASADDPSEQDLARARDFLRRHAAIDAHAHPGRSFLRGVSNLSAPVLALLDQGPSEAEAVAAMQAGGLAVACFAAVADLPVLDIRSDGLHAVRAFEPGEAWGGLQTQLANLRGLQTQALVRPVLSPRDIHAPRRAEKIGAIMAIEGGDFLEGRLERLQAVYAGGVRTITIVHYRRNEIGDIMTEPEQQRGLTDFGVQVVREMNRMGLLIDLAHAAEPTAFRTLEHATRPVMISHAHVRTAAFDHPRFISLDLAKAVADGGGVIGAWPAGIGISTLAGFVDRIIELAELVGIDHVCIGTDMDANYRPVFDDYRQLPELIARLTRRGLSRDELAKIAGGNFLRVFGAATTGEAA